MFSLILVAIALCNYSCYAATRKVIENVYIDNLIERYLLEEKFLWQSIYSNGSDHSQSNKNRILNEIRLSHDEILEDRYLEYVMSVSYTSKFIKYVDFNNIKNYAEEYQYQIHRFANTQPDSYMTLDMTFDVYNYVQEDVLFKQINEDAESTCTTWSEEMEAPNHKIYMFYELLIANVFTSYMKSQRANMNLVVKNGFEQHDFEVLRTRFNLIYKQIAGIARESLRTSNKIMWMCDENYTGDNDDSREITNFIRGYVDNQINLNRESSCLGQCSDYKFARNYDCYNGTFCDENRKVGESDPICRGTIFDCDYIDDKMEICPSMSSRNRRYEYINYGCTSNERFNHTRYTRCNAEGRYFGQSGICQTEAIVLESFRNNWLMKCDYCFCYCDEHEVDSDRYFSLRPVVSDVRDNLIISGVAIIKRNGIFSWTITQSKLLPYGRVDPYLSNYRRNVIFTDFSRSDPGIIDGIDYHTLSWQNRSVNLDTIVLPRGYVVTGVRFVVHREHLGLEIRSTKFDFNTGNLMDWHEWISKGYSDRTNLQLDRPEPNRYYDTYGAYLSVPVFRPNMFIKFRPSDPDKDAGQTTVPFIDTQLVRPKNLTPLSGIGIYYKGKPGLGGFIAPAIVVYDMSRNIGNIASTSTYT